MSAPQTLRTLSDVEAALDHENDQVRVNVLHAITQQPSGAASLHEDGRDVRDAILERLDAQSQSSVRLLGLLALAALGEDARTTRCMLDAAGATLTTQEGMIALSYLAQHAPEQARPFAERALFQPNLDLVRLAASMIEHDTALDVRARIRIRCVSPRPLPPLDVNEALEAILAEMDGPLQAGAFELVLSHHRELLPAIAARRDDVDSSTRAWLARHASHVPPEARGALLTAGLEDDAAEVRRATLDAALHLGLDDSGLDPARIRSFLGGNSAEWARALRLLGDPAEAIATCTRPDVPLDVRLAALHTLARHPNQIDRAILEGFLDDAEWRIRAAAAELVAHRDDVDAWFTLERWETASDRARLALSRAAMDANRDALLEPILAKRFAA